MPAAAPEVRPLHLVQLEHCLLSAVVDGVLDEVERPALGYVLPLHVEALMGRLRARELRGRGQGRVSAWSCRSYRHSGGLGSLRVDVELQRVRQAGRLAGCVGSRNQHCMFASNPADGALAEFAAIQVLKSIWKKPSQVSLTGQTRSGDSLPFVFGCLVGALRRGRRDLLLVRDHCERLQRANCIQRDTEPIFTERLPG